MLVKHALGRIFRFAVVSPIFSGTLSEIARNTHPTASTISLIANRSDRRTFFPVFSGVEFSGDVRAGGRTNSILERIIRVHAFWPQESAYVIQSEILSEIFTGLNDSKNTTVSQKIFTVRWLVCLELFRYIYIYIFVYIYLSSLWSRKIVTSYPNNDFRQKQPSIVYCVCTVHIILRFLFYFFRRFYTSLTVIWTKTFISSNLSITVSPVKIS